MAKWYEIYPKLALLLLEIYKSNNDKASTFLYDRIKNQSAEFKKSQWYLRGLSKVKRPGIDPIHIFSSFNQARQKAEQRKFIINNLFRILGSKNRYESIDFDGCPCPFSLKLMSIRDIETQGKIWTAFFKVISQKQKGIDDSIFINLKSWYGIDVVSFTIFLFWIDPKNFLPLDKNTQKLFYETGIIKSVPKKYTEYQRLLIKSDSNFYIDIAKKSFSLTHGEKIGKSFIQQLRRAYKSEALHAGGRFDFKIIAIQPLPKTIRKHLKILKQKVVYSFYSEYNFHSDGKIEYNDDVHLDIYSTADVNINVCAVVGKNGSGKSTISELIFLAINNIAYKVLGNNAHSDLTHEPGVNLSLYYQTGTFCKLTLNGKRVTITEYDYKKPYYVPKRSRTNLAGVDLAEMFYTIAINYSHYSLNSLELGSWIKNLFHKNDGYQTPLVINPFRDEGNFNINRENELVKSRLLANVLQGVNTEDKNNLRVITENDRYIKDIRFYLHQNKIGNLDEEALPNTDFIFNQFLEYFNLGNSKMPSKLRDIVKKYLVSKLHKICKTYQPYKSFLAEGAVYINITLLIDLFKKIEGDKSHITYKVRQVKNFIKYRTYNWIKVGEKIPLDELRIFIEEKESLESKEREVRTIEFIPPSFYDFDLILDDNSDFVKLSSGEKQRINTVSSIVYHLNNLNSVTEENDFITYPLVNIIFDEIELYFHPEMQRKFVSYLLNYISRASLDNIIALNFCFITHSPFILSDIPTQNILFLGEDGLPDKSLYSTKTFAGNIHDLLGNNFFLSNEGYMGEFANERINSAIKYLEKNEKDSKNESDSFNWNESEIRKFIDLIGEPLIQESLRELYLEKFKGNRISEIDQEIMRLQKLKLEME